jgi:ectoine hydroxylase-related dioxygenase (phytanoyl-CoA dioxygenase family)
VPTSGSICHGETGAGAGILDCAGAHPELAEICSSEILLRHEMLDLAELAMGSVQLDSIQTSSLHQAALQYAGQVGTAGWHRDGVNTTSGGAWWRWAKHDGPRMTYSCMGVNCLVYLQDMTPESGPLRVIPASVS